MLNSLNMNTMKQPSLWHRTDFGFALVVRGLLLVVLLLAVGCGGEETSAEKEKSKEALAEKAKKEAERVNVAVGKFVIREPRPTENMKLDLRFNLDIVVQQKNKAKLEEEIETHRNRLKDQVITAIRTAQTPEFDEPTLDKIKHRIQIRIRSLLEGIPIEGLYITDYQCQIN